MKEVKDLFILITIYHVTLNVMNFNQRLVTDIQIVGYWTQISIFVSKKCE